MLMLLYFLKATTKNLFKDGLQLYFNLRNQKNITMYLKTKYWVFVGKEDEKYTAGKSFHAKRKMFWWKIIIKSSDALYTLRVGNFINLFEFVAKPRFPSKRLRKKSRKTLYKQILPNLHGFALMNTSIIKIWVIIFFLEIIWKIVKILRKKICGNYTKLYKINNIFHELHDPIQFIDLK